MRDIWETIVSTGRGLRISTSATFRAGVAILPLLLASLSSLLPSSAHGAPRGPPSVTAMQTSIAPWRVRGRTQHVTEEGKDTSEGYPWRPELENLHAAYHSSEPGYLRADSARVLIRATRPNWRS